MGNIFMVLINTLNSIPVSGEDNMRKMLGVIQTLRKMEDAINEPDEEGAVADG